MHLHGSPTSGSRSPRRTDARARRLGAAALFAAATALALVLAPRVASAATLLPCPPGATEIHVDPLITSGLDDGSHYVDAALVNQVFPNGIPFVQTYNDFYLNINGNISFGQAVSSYTPDAIPGLTVPTIAGYFGDVDLRPADQGDLYLCVDPGGGRIMATWVAVGYYSQKTDKLNSFQIILTANDPSTCAAAPTFGVEFRYEQLEWTTGDASDGVGGLGGTPAVAGIDAGNVVDAVALPGSHTGAVLDLVNLTNKNEPGAFAFLVAAGQLPTCGNGTLQLCEVCDDGNQDNNDACTNLCQPNVCGDGFVDPNVEACDVYEFAGNPSCPPGTTGTPLCNNDPANPFADGSCTLSFPPAGCVDEDECQAEVPPCGATAICNNLPGGYECACQPGYQSDGFDCYDINECALPQPPCDPNATCANSPGSFTCTCKPGYVGSGLTCTVSDSDLDGLTDEEEIALGTDPFDADSDDDGVLDGQEIDPGGDADGDGLINALDPDSDNDFLKDGTEMGFGCGHPDTNVAAGNCVPDADGGATTTNPLNPDTDGGGAGDGSEDWNLNGAVDPGETNPGGGGQGDDATVQDSDGDGLSDPLELALGSNPNDADSDDDGVADAIEVQPLADTDGDGLINILDADSDNDGLFDGTELGLGCNLPGTNVAAGNCVPDADSGATTTSPILADTDGGGVKDGAEDANHNGVVNPGETNPNNPADDSSVVDSDQDGLSDAQEIFLGTDPFDNDSDDDGIKDGDEMNPSADADGDGLTNAADPDSDNDGILDGTEMGITCGLPVLMNCVSDADAGATTTNPLDADTDGGGVKDGVEDKNKNGKIDPGETDPNDPSDDACTMTTDCALAGQVCDPTTTECVDAKCDGSFQCPPPDACHQAGQCNAVTGLCDYANAPNGKACTDGNVCTSDTCQNGACVSQSLLDGTPCTQDGNSGQCIAGFCLVDSTGDGGGNGQGGSGASGGNGQGGDGGDGGAGDGAGKGQGADGAGANGEGGDEAGGYTLLGGACSTGSGSSGSSGAGAGLLLALAFALRSARRGRKRAA